MRRRRARQSLLVRSDFLRLQRLALCRRVSGARAEPSEWFIACDHALRTAPVPVTFASTDEHLAAAWDRLLTAGEVI